MDATVAVSRVGGGGGGEERSEAVSRVNMSIGECLGLFFKQACNNLVGESN